MPISATSPRRDVRWVGLRPNERREQRRVLLVDTAFDLLGTEGAAGTTVRAVCAQAALNPRYFYESFEDIDALLVAVYDHVAAQLAQAISVAPIRAAKSSLDAARRGMEAIVRFIDEDRRRARVLYVEALGNEALARHRLAMDRAAVVSLEEQAIEAAGAWPQGERVSQVGAAMLIGGISGVLRDWIDGRIAVTRDQLVDDLAELSLALGETTEKIARRRARSKK
ncbi:MAG: TetR/AcrR family transcriptional regulator [Actinobacteria bacterium]|nr:TetR/AcrR family transcriptional regulator [Actinomycetota bacterium]